MSWTVNAPPWLTARPIAHRGLHDAAQGYVENSLSAARRAIERNYAIECDVQMSADGEALVIHDETLTRLVGIAGDVSALSAEEATQLVYKESRDRIATLSSLLAEIAGRVPLIVEVKSRFDGDARLARRVADLAADYPGPLALKSFDPQILLMLRALSVSVPVGVVAQAHYTARDWPRLDERRRKALAALTDFVSAKPDFLSWCVKDLPHVVPLLCRAGMGLPVMVWTVRTRNDQALAAQFADQIIFEGFEA